MGLVCGVLFIKVLYEWKRERENERVGQRQVGERERQVREREREVGSKTSTGCQHVRQTSLPNHYINYSPFPQITYKIIIVITINYILESNLTTNAIHAIHGLFRYITVQ